MKTARDILDFWFVQHGRDDWFGASATFDAAITEQFGDTYAAVARGEAWGWRSTPEGRLAEIIVLDQFSRQMFRGAGEAFATDRMALTLAQEAVAGGHHNFVPAMPQRMFMLLPYQHSESALVQAESVRLHIALGDSEMLKYAEGHADVIRRFGRFPKRNAALGRESTPAELEYIASTEGMF